MIIYTAFCLLLQLQKNGDSIMGRRENTVVCILLNSLYALFINYIFTLTILEVFICFFIKT